MKTLLALPAALCLALLFAGCPYLSSVAIDKPSIPINPKWLGMWDEQKDHDIYRVTKQDDFTYHVEVTKHMNSSKIDKHRAYASVINGTTFLNEWNDENPTSTTKFALIKIEQVQNDRIELSPVTENIRETFASSDDLKKFIIANMKISYFFDRPMVLVRTWEK